MPALRLGDGRLYGLGRWQLRRIFSSAAQAHPTALRTRRREAQRGDHRMSFIIRVVGPAGYERFLALRLVDREKADQFEHADKALGMADAVQAALGCYADAIDHEDAENRP